MDVGVGSRMNLSVNGVAGGVDHGVTHAVTGVNGAVSNAVIRPVAGAVDGGADPVTHDLDVAGGAELPGEPLELGAQRAGDVGVDQGLEGAQGAAQASRS